MQTFDGFQPGKQHLVRLPESFFMQLLPLIDDVNELKLTLFCFWAMEQQDGRYRYLRHADLTIPEVPSPLDDPETLAVALARSLKRGTLLAVNIEGANGLETLVFLNTPNGRTAVEQIAAGNWRPGDADRPVEVLPPPPNIYRLYEANIGVLTPMIADELRDAAETYPAAWVEEAIQIAVTRNARNWRYVCAVLERWQKDGKDDGKESRHGVTREDAEANRNRFISGKYADLIEQ